MADTEAARLDESDKPQLADSCAVMEQVRSTGIQVNLSEMCAQTTEKGTPQHIVDEEAILQLMKNCPMCHRTCRCSKRTQGPYLIVYQSCYFCDYQRKWASQPEARNINIHKAKTKSKRKLAPKDKAQTSQTEKTGVSESSVSESHDPSDT